MKKVLIITYYWPPAGGPGVQRVLKFAKYLPQLDWQPIILTIKNGEYPAIDKSLADEIPKEALVYKTDSLEPNALYKKFVGYKKEDKLPVALLAENEINFKKRIANWIRLNIFIPDAKIGWKPYAVSKGKKIIDQLKPDLIFSSSPPPTVHLIAKKLAEYSGIKWVADFRDPWTNIYHYDKITKPLHQQYIDSHLEQSVLQSCDKIVTVGENVASLLDKEEKFKEKIYLIPNGYDQEEIERIGEPEKFAKFTIAYAGKMNNQQNPANLWQACANLAERNENFAKNFQILLMGIISDEVKRDISKYGLDNYVIYTGYIDHKSALLNLKRSHLLLLVIPDSKDNKGIFTGKIFEYIALNNFILGFGPKDGEAQKILNETKTGLMADFNDDVSDVIEKIFSEYRNNNLANENCDKISKFSRKTLTKKLVDVFNL